jgi:hypothetical protein
VGRASATILAAGLALAACGTQSKLTPQQSVQNALNNLGAQSSLKVSVSLHLSSSQIESLSAADGGTAAPAAAAKAISQGAFFLGLQSGHGESLNSQRFTTDDSDRLALGLSSGSSTPVELRLVDQTVYLHLNPSELSNLGGSSTGSNLASDLQKAAQVLPGLSSLAHGGWVSVSLSELQSLEGMLSELGGAGSSSNTTSNLPTAASELRSQLINALGAHATYAYEGSSGGRSEYLVTLNVKGFVDEMAPVIQQGVSSLSGLPSSMTSKLSDIGSKISKEVPAGKTVKMTLYVKNGVASEIDFDLRQAGVKANFAVPLRIAFSQTTIDKPSGATPLNLSNLPQMLQGVLGNSSSAAA